MARTIATCFGQLLSSLPTDELFMKRTESESESDGTQQASSERRRFSQIGSGSLVFSTISHAPVTILTRSLRFYVAHAVAIIGLGLFASIGRVIQVSWDASISLPLYLLLEGIVEGVRIGILLVGIGGGNLSAGIATSRRIYKMSEQERETHVESMATTFKDNGIDVAVSFVIFGIFVYLIPNMIISQIAETESVRRVVQDLWLQGVDDESLRTVIVLFIKNITIIPFTIIWMFYGLPDFLRKPDKYTTKR